MNILQLGEAINNYLMKSNSQTTVKILKALGGNIFLVDTTSGTMKAKVMGEVNIGDVIKAKLTGKMPVPTFEKITTASTDNITTVKILKALGGNIFLVDTTSGTMKAKVMGEVNIGDVIKAKLTGKMPVPTFEKITTASIDNITTVKILKELGGNIFLVDTTSGTMKAKVMGEVNIGDVIKAKLTGKMPVPIFEKTTTASTELKSDKTLLKTLENFNAEDFDVNVLNSLGKESIKNVINEEKMKLLKLIEKQVNSGEKVDLTNFSNLETTKINSKELYQLIFNRYIVIYFRAPEYDIRDGFLYIRKYKERGIRCRVFLFFSNIGRVFIFISGLNEQYNVIVKSDIDLSFALKNIVLDNATINWKKIDKKNYDNEDFFHSNYFSIKI